MIEWFRKMTGHETYPHQIAAYEALGLTPPQDDLYSAEECFMTGTGAELVPVIEIDDRIVADGKPGPLTLQLIEDYKKLVAA